MKTRVVLAAAGLLGGVCAAACAQSQLILDDTFAPAPSALWYSVRGDWTYSGGLYYASQPGNIPPTAAMLPFELGDCDVYVDLSRIRDGGVWLHANTDATNGILLVTGGYTGTYPGFYWHVVTNGSYGPAFGFSGNVLTLGTDVSFHVRIRGPVYEVFLDGNPNPVTSMNDSNFASGRVGLYDFAPYPEESFDRVTIYVPPTCVPDYNQDGGADLGDILDLAADIAGGTASFPPNSPDFNGDGSSDLSDVFDLANVVAGGNCP